MKWIISGLALAVAGADFASAQEEGAMTATGLVMAPSGDEATMVGAGTYWTRNASLGGYFNFASSVEAGSFLESLSLGRSAASDAATGYVVNLGATYQIGNDIAAYGGVGLAGTSPGASSPPTDVEDQGFNANVGMLVDLGDLSLDLGYNSFFTTTYVGIGFEF